ncbi:F-box/FBD/LRR-repeat protein-like protein [Tanacetum coccineum]
MEQLHGTLKEPKYVSEDIISSMPDNVMSNILDRLPVQEAVRTSILSKDWRFKWNLLTQLIFDCEFFCSSRNTKRINYGRIISMLLHGLKGSIKKFELNLCEGDYSMIGVEVVKNWVIFVSENGIEDFTLLVQSKTPFKLPIQIFSCLKLKRLMLCNCSFDPTSSFRGFPNLLSLDLDFVTFESYQCGELLTQCPSLEYLRLASGITTAKIKEVEIAKLKNLKVLSLDLSKLENMETITRSTIFRLMSFFPKLQKFDLDIVNCKLLSDTEKRAPTSFPYLKALTLKQIDFSSEVMTSLAIEFICASPNLETLWISGTWKNDVPPPTDYTTEVKCISFGQLRQLRDVVLGSCRGLENEVCFIKSLLACSPVLKRMSVIFSSVYSNQVLGSHDRDREKLRFAKELLTFHRASPVAEIFLYSL